MLQIVSHHVVNEPVSLRRSRKFAMSATCDAEMVCIAGNVPRSGGLGFVQSSRGSFTSVMRVPSAGGCTHISFSGRQQCAPIGCLPFYPAPIIS